MCHLLTILHAFLCCVSLMGLDFGTYCGKQRFGRQVTARGFNEMAWINSVSFGAYFPQDNLFHQGTLMRHTVTKGVSPTDPNPMCGPQK